MPPAPPTPVSEPVPVVPPMPEDMVGSRSLDDLNRDSPLRPLFFELDSSDVSQEGMKTMQDNAAVLKKYPAMQITIEGHCDERGTAEYNLALGERRALAARNYLVSLGIPADKIKTVSYGKEFPFDAGHDDAAWQKNRRAHFVITAK
jgi:peptidoglycan-associated lipoprotein